jgi:hypothetical protein
MERSEIRGGQLRFTVPDFASLHPGYGAETPSRHSGAMPTGPRKARPDDRLRIEPGISRFPDVQLHI